MKLTRPIAISLSPNTEPDDIRLAWDMLLNYPTGRWKDSGTVSEAAQAISNYFDGRSVILTSSGRQALFDVLRAFGVGSGDEVIIQAFTCIAVPEPVMWTGATPVYADIIPETYTVDPADVARKITSRTKAIIVQHTFGIPGPLEDLQRIAKERGLILIEDCAHSLGAKVDGRPLGTFGDAAILSFGRDKALSSVFGGAIVTNNPEIIKRLQQMQSERPLPPARWVAQQLVHPIIMNAILPWYFSGVGKAALVAAQRLRILSKAVETDERSGGKPDHVSYQYSPALAALLMRQWQKLDRYTQRRRNIAERYAQVFGSIAESAGSSWLRFPLQIQKAQEALAGGKAQGILLGDWYDGPLAPSNCSLSAFQYAPGSCPRAEEAAAGVINLPTYPLLTDSQVEQVIDYVKTVV